MYYLGIDGGGTKTTVALADERSNILCQVKLGPTNPVDIGMGAVLSTLGEGISQVLRDIDPREVSVFAGIAGGITGENQARIRAFLSTFGFANAANGSDAQNIVSAGLGRADGICVIMGTGSVTFVQHRGERMRLGGYGYLFDEGGNGYTIGRDAILACLKAEEGSGEETMLHDLLLQTINAPTVLSSLSAFYDGGKKQIASYAPLVFKAYDAGDSIAAYILRNNMKFVAQSLCDAKNKLQTKRSVRTVLAGGLTARADVLIPMIREQLEDGVTYDIRVLQQPPVMGALWLAGMPREEI